jgi:phosphoglycolate phosphatase-like HAD superfamily hydrolase
MSIEKTGLKSKFVVGFDMDGVIIDHMQNKLILAKQYGYALSKEETHSEILPKKIPHEQYGLLQGELYGNSELALSAPLMKGALRGLEELQEKNIPFVLISRRRVPENAIALLDRRGLWGPFFTLQNTTFVESPEEKNIVAMREGVTHYIDDERKVLRLMPDVRSRFLFDEFQQFEDEKEFPRLFDWSMLLEQITAPSV